MKLTVAQIPTDSNAVFSLNKWSGQRTTHKQYKEDIDSHPDIQTHV